MSFGVLADSNDSVGCSLKRRLRGLRSPDFYIQSYYCPLNLSLMYPRFRLCIIRKLKGKQKNYTNYTHPLHLTLHSADFPRFKTCIVCASNYTQTIHKPYIEAFKTLHSERSQNYTRSGTQTLHFVFEHESREWNLEREWSKSYVTFVTNVTNVTNVSNVRNVKQEMAIGGDATRHSCKPQKNPTILSHFSAIRH